MRHKPNYDDSVLEIPRLTYRDLREEHVFTGGEYSPGKIHIPKADYCLDQSRVIARFCDYQDAGLVRAVAVPDEEPYDAGDMFTKEGLPRKSKREREHMESEFFDKVNREGVWGIILQFRASEDGDWENSDSLWGIVVFNESKRDSLPYFAATDMDLETCVNSLEFALCGNVASI